MKINEKKTNTCTFDYDFMNKQNNERNSSYTIILYWFKSYIIVKIEIEIYKFYHPQNCNTHHTLQEYKMLISYCMKSQQTTLKTESVEIWKIELYNIIIF